jgi:hypothetical protein
MAVKMSAVCCLLCCDTASRRLVRCYQRFGETCSLRSAGHTRKMVTTCKTARSHNEKYKGTSESKVHHFLM